MEGPNVSLKFQKRLMNAAAAVLTNINKLFLDIGTCLYIYVCMYVYIILLNSHDYLKKTSIKINVATDEGNI